MEHGGRRRVCLGIAGHIINADGIVLVPVLEFYDPFLLEIGSELFRLGAEMGRRQPYRQLDVVQLFLVNAAGRQFLRNRNQGEDKKAVVPSLVLAVRNTLVGERIVVAAVLQARPERPGHALLQAGNERGAVNRLDLFITMIDTN